jgi:hypothetical protein
MGRSLSVWIVFLRPQTRNRLGQHPEAFKQVRARWNSENCQMKYFGRSGSYVKHHLTFNSAEVVTTPNQARILVCIHWSRNLQSWVLWSGRLLRTADHLNQLSQVNC